MRWWTGFHDLSFWMLSFKPAFSLSSFTFIKRLFSFSSLSSIRVVSSAYLRLLVFLPAILIPACASYSPVSNAYKLNKQGDNIQPWRTPFPIWNQSVVAPPKYPGVYFQDSGTLWNLVNVKSLAFPPAPRIMKARAWKASKNKQTKKLQWILDYRVDLLIVSEGFGLWT